MLLSIVTPQKKLIVDHEVEQVVLPGHKGQLTILTGHAPLITTLGIGVLKFKTKGNSEFQKYAISWGYCEIAGNTIKVLAETAEKSEEIDKARAKKSLENSEKLLGESKELSLEETDKHINKIKKAQVRLEI